MELYENINYTSEISYLTNTFIYELDIQKANINVLYSKKVISKDIYDFLKNSERMVRQVYVGKLQKNPDVVNALKQGIIEAKKMLFEANQIQDYEVLSIKNDAVFIIGRLPQIRQFGLINFIPKNVYTGFYKVLNYEFYYYYNKLNKEEVLHVKGIGKSIEKHIGYFYDFLKDLFYTIQCDGIEIALRLLKDYYLQYITLQLPIGHYRRFNPISDYHFKIITDAGNGFSMDNASDDQKPLLDISNNLKMLLELNKILNNIYFNKY